MNIFKNCLLLILALLLFSSCMSSPNMQRINVSSNTSSQILNLKNSGNGNTNTFIADRIMRNGFLGSGEEYGYFTLNMSYSHAGGDMSVWVYLGIPTLLSWHLLGVPTHYDDYSLTVNLDIIDSNMNVIWSYSDSTKIRQYAGLYYGDATNKASSAFTHLIRNVQRRAAADSTSINADLRDAGPIEIRQSVQAGNTPSGQQGQTQQNDIVGALNNAARVVMNTLQERNFRNQKIAIVNIFSADSEQSVFVVGELEHILVQNRFTVVDRRELDRIRREQNFQLSGEVDDAQIVSIGKFAGADLVIAGSITGSGAMRRLRFRVLDTESAELRASASEFF